MCVVRDQQNCGCIIDHNFLLKSCLKLKEESSSEVECVVSVAGVEVRDNGFIVIQDSEITNSGSQGLVSHAGALGYIARRSSVLLLTANTWMLGFYKPYQNVEKSKLVCPFPRARMCGELVPRRRQDVVDVAGACV